ncbi:hypothetical protein DQ400_18660 [Vreelandella sulfidaeris]|uniref:Uncharacterized protein n=1 Tax=Vreelandella sulfidaeris TaxID=115553 RepID=A0A365TIQ9_9GAMM|nr:hypothetical protein [Halomonas sulfidaeris]RBI65378.1 hypothetical protein DQ400_18660 [Halomonas sulfidaeris]
MSFYPHARVGRDKTLAKIANHRANFLSARPGRGATTAIKLSLMYDVVSIRTPRAGRDFWLYLDQRWRAKLLSDTPPFRSTKGIADGRDTTRQN